jgi:hypothetical protein
MMRKILGLAVLALGAFGAGCGQTSYFSVKVIVDDATGREMNKMVQIDRVQVNPSGAISEQGSFLLDTFPRSNSYVYSTEANTGQIILGTFEYGTTAGSGDVSFDVRLKNGSANDLAAGSNHAAIQAGADVALTVRVKPDTSVWQ